VPADPVNIIVPVISSVSPGTFANNVAFTLTVNGVGFTNLNAGGGSAIGILGVTPNDKWVGPVVIVSDTKITVAITSTTLNGFTCSSCTAQFAWGTGATGEYTNTANLFTVT